MHSSALMCFPFPQILLYIFCSDSRDSDTSTEKRRISFFGACLCVSAEYLRTQIGHSAFKSNISFYGNYRNILHSSLLSSRCRLFNIVARNMKWNSLHLALLKDFTKDHKTIFWDVTGLVQVSSSVHLSYKYQKWASTWTRGGLGKINRLRGIYMKST